MDHKNTIMRSCVIMSFIDFIFQVHGFVTASLKQCFKQSVVKEFQHDLTNDK